MASERILQHGVGQAPMQDRNRKHAYPGTGGEGKIGNATDEISTLTPSVVPKSKEVIPSLTKQEL